MQAQWPADIVPGSTPPVAFDLKVPLQATGGRLLVEGGAPFGLALYGSNDAGQTVHPQEKRLQGLLQGFEALDHSR